MLLICKYSRTPSLGTDANFHSEFYKFSVSRVRVKAEEHGEYETHFQLYTTQKSAVFIAKYVLFLLKTCLFDTHHLAKLFAVVFLLQWSKNHNS